MCGWEMDIQCHLILYQKRDELKQAGNSFKATKRNVLGWVGFFTQCVSQF